MISRMYRFHGYGALKGVYQRGKTVRGPVMSLKFAPNNRSKYRIAVVVSKKVHKSAVVRNRIRRRVYEICRKQDVVDMTGFDFVFTVFSEQLEKVEHQKIEKYTLDLLKKVT